MTDTEKFKDINYVRTIAKQRAQKLKTNFSIYPAKIHGYNVFQFCEEGEITTGIIETVRYTGGDTGKKVLSDNERQRPEPVKKKSRGKSKSGNPV